MIRPICVIYIPADYSFSNAGMAPEPLKLMKELNGWNAPNEQDKEDVVGRFGGYMYWCFAKGDIDAPELQVFHPKDFTELDYKQLEQFVKDKINEITNVSTT